MSSLLHVQELHVALGGERILHGVSFESGPGVLGIWGANGSGKSTLLKTIAGIVQPLDGSVAIAGADLMKEPVKARQHLGYMPEHADLYPHLTCRELAETVTALRGAASDVWLEWLTPLGLQGMEDVRLGTMSAGQQRKVTLILALCGEPTLLLLDEPTKALDEASREFLKEVIQKKRERSLIVITSHLKEYLQTHCTHFLRMKDGRNEALETELR